MNRTDVEKLHSWFAGYAAGFYTDDSDQNRVFHLKETHTERVCKNIRILADDLDLGESDRCLAETMAVLHDVGRFKQYAVYRTFNDQVSENHAKIGLQQIAKYRLLGIVSKEEKRLICRAVAFHNTAELPADEDRRSLVFMRLLRDADKLDIWQTASRYYRDINSQPPVFNEFCLPDDPYCSPSVLYALHEKRIVRWQDIQTLNDFKLLQIGWVFDLNYTASFREVQHRQLIEQMQATMPLTEDISAAVQQAKRYVESRAAGGPT